MQNVKDLPFSREKYDEKTIKEVLTAIRDNIDLPDEESEWFSHLKQIGGTLGFAQNNKEFKENPANYKGVVADVAEILRITLTTRKNSPNLYYVMRVLGLEKSKQRIDHILSLL